MQGTVDAEVELAVAGVYVPFLQSSVIFIRVA